MKPAPCKTCGETKPRTTEFYYRDGKTRLSGACKVCVRARQKVNYESKKQGRTGRSKYMTVSSSCCPAGAAALQGHTERIRKELGIL